jgi:hypothetical protein
LDKTKNINCFYFFLIVTVYQVLGIIIRKGNEEKEMLRKVYHHCRHDVMIPIPPHIFIQFRCIYRKLDALDLFLHMESEFSIEYAHWLLATKNDIPQRNIDIQTYCSLGSCMFKGLPSEE